MLSVRMALKTYHMYVVIAQILFNGHWIVLDSDITDLQGWRKITKLNAILNSNFQYTHLNHLLYFNCVCLYLYICCYCKKSGTQNFKFGERYIKKNKFKNIRTMEIKQWYMTF